MDRVLAEVAANEMPQGTQILYSRYAQDGKSYSCEYLPDVPYVTYGDITLKLQIIKPMAAEEKMPLVVFIQGSGWKKQNLYFEIPNLSVIAAQGYVVASVEYRSIPEYRYPAQLEDVKCAIRFLRKNADQFCVNPNNVAIWGDSSGGHLSLMTGLTIGQFNNGHYAEQSDEVLAVVDYYGITDISTMGKFNDILDHDADDAPEALLIGGKVSQNMEKAKQASPLYQNMDRPLPPFLLIHGDNDIVVHVSQSIEMFKALQRHGKNVQFYKVLGADHIFGFWNPDVLQVTERFLSTYLKRPPASFYAPPPASQPQNAGDPR